MGLLFLSLVNGTIVVLLGLTESLVLLHQFSSLFNIFCSTSETVFGNLSLMMIANHLQIQLSNTQPHLDSIAVRPWPCSTAGAIKRHLVDSPWHSRPAWSPIRLDIIYLLLSMEAIHLSKRGGTPCLSSAEVIASIEFSWINCPLEQVPILAVHPVGLQVWLPPLLWTVIDFFWIRKISL